MTGTTRITPGPLTPVKRPSVNITPRSYSFRILMALKISVAARNITTRMNGLILDPSRCSQRLDVQHQPFHSRDAHALPRTQGNRALRLPDFSPETHHTAPAEILDRFRSAADDVLGP